MTIKKKIAISNILMILLPFLAGLILLLIAGESLEMRYGETLQAMYHDKNGVYSAQSFITAYSEEIFEKAEWENKKPIRNKNMQVLEEQLADLGYHFSVFLNKENYFSNIDRHEKKHINEILGATFWEADDLVVTSNNNVIVKNIFFNQSKGSCEIIAIHIEENKPVVDSSTYLKNILISNIILMIFIVFAFIIMLNSALSYWISKSILTPLIKLHAGTRRIRDGELDFEVTYKNQDEFGEVIRDFDEMRGHLKKSVEEQLRYEKYRKKLLAGISHDLRTPLTSIKGYIEGLLEGIADTPEKQHRYYKAIQTRTKDLENLVESLSTYTTFEKNAYQFHMERTELNCFMQSIYQEYNTTIIIDKVKIQLQLYPKPLWVRIDQKSISRAIHNIVENSMKYSGNEELVITIETWMNEKSAMLRITDNGKGVNEEEIQEIFECFYRGDEARSNPGMGSGLGLSIVKQIVSEHGGQIIAENRNGFSILITLPLCG